MGLFNTILEKLGMVKEKAAEVLGGKKAEAAEASVVTEATTPEAAPVVEAAPAVEPAPVVEVDVFAVCEELAKKNPQKLNWKTSIVDLMKLLGIDPSLANRKELAEELGCPKELIGGDYSQMNIWLHKAVMQKLAENGGKVPQELLD